MEENIDTISDVLGLELTVEERERSVGRYSLDLLVKDGNDDLVVIETDR